MDKDFIDVKAGDTLYMIKIDDSKLPARDIIKELEVMEIMPVPQATHMRVTLSDTTVITPSPAIGFHVIDTKFESDKKYDGFESSISKEIYATSKHECIRITHNLIKLTMHNLHNKIKDFETTLQFLEGDSYVLSALKDNVEKEVVSETVVV